MNAADPIAQAVKVLRGRRVVVALSGGRDSVALLHAAVMVRADVRAAHVDHGLRMDSAADARFCADLAADLGAVFGKANVTVQPGNSTQGRARVQRYAALTRLCSELGGDAIALAHHADDAWESSELMRERGAGPIGLAGPMPQTTWWGFPILRPLLAVRRSEIDGYIERNGLAYREDPSNTDEKYARTRVRARGDYDAAELGRRRAAAEALAVDVRQVVGTRAPARITFDRDAIRTFDRGVIVRAMLDATRGLHAELSGAIADQVAAAIADSHRHPRTFCGRRVLIHVRARQVLVCASRGQGTRYEV